MQILKEMDQHTYDQIEAKFTRDELASRDLEVRWFY